MTDKFKVGDRVRIISGCRKGLEATIISPKMTGLLISGDIRIEGAKFYRLDVQGEGTKAKSGRNISYREPWLSPIYDGYEKTTWEELAPYWKPKQLEKV